MIVCGPDVSLNPLPPEEPSPERPYSMRKLSPQPLQEWSRPAPGKAVPGPPRKYPGVTRGTLAIILP
jgi:hypothetical protein